MHPTTLSTDEGKSYSKYNVGGGYMGLSFNPALGSGGAPHAPASPSNLSLAQRAFRRQGDRATLRRLPWRLAVLASSRLASRGIPDNANESGRTPSLRVAILPSAALTPFDMKVMVKKYLDKKE